MVVMRQHLLKCLESGRMTEFPSSDIEKQSYMHTCIVGNKMIKEQKNSSAYSMHAFPCINEYHLDVVK